MDVVAMLPSWNGQKFTGISATYQRFINHTNAGFQRKKNHIMRLLGGRSRAACLGALLMAGSTGQVRSGGKVHWTGGRIRSEQKKKPSPVPEQALAGDATATLRCATPKDARHR